MCGRSPGSLGRVELNNRSLHFGGAPMALSCKTPQCLQFLRCKDPRNEHPSTPYGGRYQKFRRLLLSSLAAKCPKLLIAISVLRTNGSHMDAARTRTACQSLHLKTLFFPPSSATVRVMIVLIHASQGPRCEMLAHGRCDFYLVTAIPRQFISGWKS
jgi:hypothetical protein